MSISRHLLLKPVMSHLRPYNASLSWSCSFVNRHTCSWDSVITVLVFFPVVSMSLSFWKQIPRRSDFSRILASAVDGVMPVCLQGFPLQKSAPPRGYGVSKASVEMGGAPHRVNPWAWAVHVTQLFVTCFGSPHLSPREMTYCLV